MLQPDDLKKAATWAFQTARYLGFTWETDKDGMIWVKIPEGNEIGCNGTYDFVSFISEENKARRVKR